MKKATDQIMLITYSDSMGRNLKELTEFLDTVLKDAVGGVPLLPFFPSSGVRVFAPMTYREVYPALGGWEDVKKL